MQKFDDVNFINMFMTEVFESGDQADMFKFYLQQLLEDPTPANLVSIAIVLNKEIHELAMQCEALMQVNTDKIN